MRFIRHAIILGLSGAAILSCRPRSQTLSKLQDLLDSSIVAPGKIGNALVLGDTDLTRNRNIAAGFPTILSDRLASPMDLFLSREQFVVSFDSAAKIPAWTSWQVVKNDLGTTVRQNNFKSDDILNKYLEIKIKNLGLTPEDYRNTCFDRGHQSPSADRTRSVRDNTATFYMSNMAPQTSFLNRVIWKDLEEYSRELVKKQGRKLQIYAGSILRNGREGIGPNKEIQVPEAFYKVIEVYEDDEARSPMGYIAVIMPNVTADGLDPLAEKTIACQEQEKNGKGHLPKKWADYRVDLKDIEQKAGVSFPKLADVRSYNR